ncbi:MAG: hypothetical protein KAT91_04240, partial [Candidatus Aenigmarchaeota archaeon]|nr:hypothetical protein [Candidatus Aenigmarchaeota archaeon]
MNKLILIIVLMLLFSPEVHAVNNCELATPRYGVVQCMNTGQEETQYASFGAFDGSWSSNQIACLSNCELTSEESILIDCEGIPWDEYEIYMNGVKNDKYPIKWNRGDTLLVKGKCSVLLESYAVPEDAFVKYQQAKIMLFEGWAGSLPTTPIANTEGCVL